MLESGFAVFKADLLDSMPLILNGIWNTVLLALIITVTGVAGGIIILYFTIGESKLVKKIIKSYTSFFVGTPLVVVLFILYYGLPYYGISFSAFTAAVICFTLNVSAYNALYLTAAYRGLDAHEIEAAKSQGFSRIQVYRLIIVPQVIRRSIPTLTNQVANNFKDTAIVFLIGFIDFFARMQEIATEDFQFLYTYLTTTLVYFVMIILVTLIAKRFEHHIQTL